METGGLVPIRQRIPRAERLENTGKKSQGGWGAARDSKLRANSDASRHEVHTCNKATERAREKKEKFLKGQKNGHKTRKMQSFRAQKTEVDAPVEIAANEGWCKRLQRHCGVRGQVFSYTKKKKCPKVHFFACGN